MLRIFFPPTLTMYELELASMAPVLHQDELWLEFLGFCGLIFACGIAVGWWAARRWGQGGARIRSLPQAPAAAPQQPQPTPTPEVWDVAVQSQVTYTWRCTTPRFKPLPEGGHGAWVQRHNL